MSVTFRTEPNELSFIAFDHHLLCTALGRTDPRIFATYAEAVTGIATHSRWCTDVFCGPDMPFVVARTAAADEPAVQTSSVNGRLLLRALGLVPEIGAETVTSAETDDHVDLGGHDDLVGVCDSTELLDRIDVALALHPADAGIPWHTLSANVIDCGRRPGYLHDRLAALRGVAVYAQSSRRRVDWC
jgi:hypothetical protein